MGNDVPEGALNAPRLVRVPTPEMQNSNQWPRLGDVPSKPKDFSTPAAVNQSMTDMEGSRDEADVLRTQSGIAPAQKTNSQQPAQP